MHRTSRVTTLVLSLVSLPLALRGQSASAAPAQGEMLARYTRAEQLLPWNTNRLAYGGQVTPQWYHDGTRFWFRNTTRSGA